MKRCWILLLLLPLAVACATPLARINGRCARRPRCRWRSIRPRPRCIWTAFTSAAPNAFTAEKGGLPVTAGAHRLRLEKRMSF